MIKNYFKIALRSLLKNKIFSFINISGLSIGITCCILIALFVRNELSYDSFHLNAKNLFRVSLLENYGAGLQFFNSITPALFGPVLKEYFPEVKEYVRVSTITDMVQSEEKSFPERIHLVDPSFFKVFSFPLIKGSSAEVLQDNSSLVVTQSIAQKYFGNADPLGKTLSIKLDDSFHDFKITGIAEDAPPNSSIQFKYLINFENNKYLFSEKALHHWFVVINETYILAQPGTSSEYFESKSPSLVKTIMGENYKEGEYNLKFQPITDIHLNNEFPVGLEPISSPVYSYILSAISVLILIIASINFIMLSIGKSISRAGEVGVRKVAGARRNQLILQFWGESLLVVVAASAAAIGISEIFLPTFNTLVSKELSLSYSFNSTLIFLGIILFIGSLSGLYPALVLSGFQPIDVLKEKVKLKVKTPLNRILVITQFVISIILITCTLVINNQLNFIRGKNLGFNKEQVVSITSSMPPQESIRTGEILKNELANERDIISVSTAATTMGTSWSFIGFGDVNADYNKIFMNIVDADYIKTMGIKIIKGRDFSAEFPSDINNAVIVNETFANQFKIDLSKDIRMPGNFNQYKIIGIAKDFNFESLHSKIKPAIIVLNPDNIIRNASDISLKIDPQVFVRIRSGNFQETLKKIKTTWEKVTPQIPFKSSFLDDNIEKMYQSEMRLSAISSASSVFAIIITCLGLLGLTILITVQKTKEIGIRRVLGASVQSIFQLISKEFIVLIVTALLIGWIISYSLMNIWLEKFAYRIELNLWTFILSGIITLSIAISTISFLIIKAAIESPVKSLKYE